METPHPVLLHAPRSDIEVRIASYRRLAIGSLLSWLAVGCWIGMALQMTNALQWSQVQRIKSLFCRLTL